MKSTYYILLPCLAFLCRTAGLPTTLTPNTEDSNQQDYNSVEQQLNFLQKYGYMSTITKTAVAGELRSGTASETMRQALIAFQKMAHIPTTGVMDEKTKEMMSKPRCGNKDVVLNSRRRKRFSVQGSKWSKNILTWRIGTYTGDMDPYTQLNQIKAGLELWSIPTSLKFRNVQGGGQTDIEVGFFTGEHGDGNPFDDKGGVLAHAYFPSYGGDVHFDDSEDWTVNTNQGYNLLGVTAHEVGHALGLRHSEVEEALMAPYYQSFFEGQNPTSLLHQDDIDGIQAIYGPKPGFPGGNGGGGGGDSGDVYPSYCRSGNIDAIFSIYTHTYIFKGNDVLKLDRDDKVEVSQWPKSMNLAFPQGPPAVDAAFAVDNIIYLIKDDEVFLYDYSISYLGKFTLAGIFLGIQSGTLHKIEAAFMYEGELYIFQGSTSFSLYKYLSTWIVNRNQNIKSQWGRPSSCPKVTAAMTWKNGRAYMFCNDEKYFRLTREKQVDHEPNIPYPRPTAFWWLNCADSNANLVSLKEEASDVLPPSVNSNDQNVYNSGNAMLPNYICGFLAIFLLILCQININLLSLDCEDA